VAPFHSSGGLATFEPDTGAVEVFYYSGVNTSTNELFGIQRPDPESHALGTFVAADVDEWAIIDPIIDSIAVSTLSPMTCTATAQAPFIDDSGALVVGVGKGSCNKGPSAITVKTCIHYKEDAKWIKLGCGKKSQGGVPANTVVKRRLKEGCLARQNRTYRTRAGIAPGSVDS
jgi:hypothetical protein